jgi:ankyrin repeat protein
MFEGFWLNGARFLIGVVLSGLAAWTTGCAVPLLNASANGDSDYVAELLRQGHHANEKFPLIGTRPLILAAAAGHNETVKTLLEAGADVNAKDCTGWTALHAGAYGGNADVVSLLLKYGAVSNERGWFLNSPVDIAEALNHKEVTDLLRESSAAMTVHSRDSVQLVKSSIPNSR